MGGTLANETGCLVTAAGSDKSLGLCAATIVDPACRDVVVPSRRDVVVPSGPDDVADSLLPVALGIVVFGQPTA